MNTDRKASSRTSPDAAAAAPNEPVQAGRKPCYARLKAGRTYLWCSCGRSARQPYCDGSHRGTAFEPVAYTATEDDEEVLFCACKRTADAPFCDGTHNNLPGGYREDDPDSPENRAILVSDERRDARWCLDGGCYVFSTADADQRHHGNVEYCSVISESQGAVFQSQFSLRTRDDAWSPLISFGERHVLLLVAGGSGTVEIAGRAIPAAPTDGLYIRPGETFRLRAGHDRPLHVYASVCPVADAPAWPDAPGHAFDASWAERRVQVDTGQRHDMGSRFFQMLVDRRVGSDLATQFIGHIPRSKAEPHRHLYEESLIILSGHGFMWTETRKAPVRAGDVIFLPRRQLHSLQCTADEGMDVVGVIYPGSNPAINY